MNARLILLLALCCQVFGQPSGTQQRWRVNLRENFGLQTFDRWGKLWSTQQGVVFITPERLAVYQVNEKLFPAPLSARDAAGGAGNFQLELRILDTRDGREIKSMRFPTNGAFSRVVRAGGGKFVVRTGDVLYLFSPAFNLLASKALPLDRVAPFESWQVDAPPSGAEIVLVHQQVFIHEVLLADGTIVSPGKSQADIEVLDADTLKVTRKFSVNNYLARWSAGERSLIGTHPSQSFHAEEYGALDFDGHWKNLEVTFKGKEHCPANMDALDHGLIAAYGCNGIVVFSESGDQVFSTRGRSNELAISVAGAGNYFAVEFSSLPRSYDAKIKPLHIDLFQIENGAHLVSVPVEKNVVYCDVSAYGLLVVLEGEILSVSAAGSK